MSKDANCRGEVRIQLLGRLQARRDSDGARLPLSQRAGHLVAFLAVDVERPQRRDFVADALWPAIPLAQSRTYLRRALWQARRSLGVPSAEDLIWSDNEWLGLCCDERLQIDAVQLATTYHDLIRSPRAERPLLLAACLQAVELYEGDLLDDCFEDWCVVPLERYRSVYVTMLEWIIEEIVDRDLLLAESLCQRLLAIDRAHEWAHRNLMRVHWESGDRTRALRQFDVCRRHLLAELGVRPSNATRDLERRIRVDGHVGVVEHLTLSAAVVDATSVEYVPPEPRPLRHP